MKKVSSVSFGMAVGCVSAELAVSRVIQRSNLIVVQIKIVLSVNTVINVLLPLALHVKIVLPYAKIVIVKAKRPLNVK